MWWETRMDRSVPFVLAVVRYFAVDRLPDGTFLLRRNRDAAYIGKWAVLETPEGFAKPHTVLDLLGKSELLYADTRHSHQEHWALRQMWEAMENQAHEDVTTLLSIKTAFDEKVAELRAELDGFDAAIGTGK